jgi:hypothetical protein
MQRLRRLLCLTCLTIVCTLASTAGSVSTADKADPTIRDVSVTPPFFNPSVGQSVSIQFRAGVRGVAKVSILDRDRFPIRTLPSREVSPGLATFWWDGRDDSGAVVPNEAWNVRIELGGVTHDPSLDFHPRLDDPQPRTYSRSDGILSYRLARASRVHIEAGQATPNPKNNGRADGPILKTIVNSEPRVAGAVVEKWNGFDESGTIRVSNLPNFVVSVLAVSLPENSIITGGNRRETFLDYAARKRPASALQPKKRTAPAQHHAGLNAFEDRSPVLNVQPRGTWSAQANAWRVAGPLRIEAKLEGRSAAHFLVQPSVTTVYVDKKLVLTQKSPANPLVVTIPASELPAGEHRIAVNWGSDYGPAALGSFRVIVPIAKAEARR